LETERSQEFHSGTKVSNVLGDEYEQETLIGQELDTSWTGEVPEAEIYFGTRLRSSTSDLEHPYEIEQEARYLLDSARELESNPQSRQEREQDLPVIKVEGLATSARRLVQGFANKAMAKMADKILDELCNALIDIDSRKLPPIRAFEPEDGSLLIEWIFPHHRLGFSIEPDEQESGWFLVSDKSAHRIAASGFLVGEDIRRRVNWLLEPVLNYYL
jgi:hypothetical protein